jgi:hypothetical protein
MRDVDDVGRDVIRSGLCADLATCFGAATVTLGSELEEPAACDRAVPLRAQSNTVDRIATAEGATKPDDNLMAKSSSDVLIA